MAACVKTHAALPGLIVSPTDKWHTVAQENQVFLTPDGYGRPERVVHQLKREEHPNSVRLIWKYTLTRLELLDLGPDVQCTLNVGGRNVRTGVPLGRDVVFDFNDWHSTRYAQVTRSHYMNLSRIESVVVYFPRSFVLPQEIRVRLHTESGDVVYDTLYPYNSINLRLSYPTETLTFYGAPQFSASLRIDSALYGPFTSDERGYLRLGFEWTDLKAARIGYINTWLPDDVNKHTVNFSRFDDMQVVEHSGKTIEHVAQKHYNVCVNDGTVLFSG